MIDNDYFLPKSIMKKGVDKTPELAAERQERLRAILRIRRIVRVEPLCEELGASPATVRRDLLDMERRGLLRRVHGGAVCTDAPLDEPLFDDKTAIAAPEKRAIAEAALGLIRDGATIYLDGGSTVLELARLLRDRTELTVVTNSLRAAVELSGRGPRLILPGGELRRRSQTLVGALTEPLLSQLRVQQAFMGTIGLSIEEGATTTDPNEAFTKRLVLERADEVTLLADSQKIGANAFAHAGDLRRFRRIITDRGAPASFVRHVKKMGIEIITA